MVGIGLMTALASGSTAGSVAVAYDGAGAYDRGEYVRTVFRDSRVEYLHDPDITFFVTGREGFAPTMDAVEWEFRSFFVFELDVIDALVTKAALVIHFNGAAYNSLDGSETFAVYDVSTDIDTLRAGGDKDTPGLDAIWDDLGSGHKYGSHTFTASEQDTFVRIPLDATARLKARAGGKLALGGAITTLTSYASYTEQLFQLSSIDSVQLDITVAGSQPDGWIQSGPGVAGYGVVNTTAVDQTLTRSAARGKTLTFRVNITNASGVDDRYRIKAGGSTRAYQVHYLVDGQDVTNAVVAGTYRTPWIESAQANELIAKITVTASATAGSKVGRLITITSIGDPTRVDVVKAVAKRR